MPEIKNTFLKGKMNKDLDARLIPNGEYVDAQNIHIAKSDGSDVGVVQNVKGNSKIGNLNISGEVIGYIADSESLPNGNNRIFYFVSAGGANDNIYYYETGSASNPVKIINNTSNFLNFSTSHLITGVNIIDDLLFWTDDNNQPRKINIIKALENSSNYNNLYYNSEVKISVAKYFPYNAPEVLNPTVDSQTGMQKLTTTQSVTTTSSSNDVTYTGNVNYDIYAGQSVSGAGIPADTFVQSVSTNGLTITLTKPPGGSATSTLTFKNTEDRIEEEFIKFAYRYKFEDGEYSVISPFTQTCFIPKTYSNGAAGLTGPQIASAATTTEVDSFINDVGRVQLRVGLPSTLVTSTYGINKIEILYKEADNPGIKAVAEIPLSDTNVTTNTSYSLVGNLFTYNYELTLPFKTLTEDQLTRVFDNVPRKAKAQEIAGSRLIYGNFQENYNLPTVDFEAKYANKLANGTWNVQYPYQSVKSRRTYQVGLVLSDKYGRQSPVILPSDSNKSSVRVPVHTGDSGNWDGYALKIEFNDTIDNAYSTSNEFGWYSWKVVVKQTEQEYYNIYAPSAIDNIPDSSVQSAHSSLYFSDTDKRTWLVLHGDNINKVPRKPGVGGVVDETTSASESSLFPVIIDGSLTPNGSSSDPFIYNSEEGKVDVISIGSAMDHGLELFDTTATGSAQELGHTYLVFHNYSKNPLLAELPDGYGKSITVSSNPKNQQPLNFLGTLGLSIFETEPFKSGLDIYYETSLSGLVEALNLEIGGATGGPTGLTITSSSFSEGDVANTIIGALGATNSTGSNLTNISFTINSVYAQSDLNTNLANNFDINSGNLRVKNPVFYYGSNGESYNFSITAVDANGEDHTDNLVITLTNAAPTFSNSLSATANSLHYSTVQTILNAANGTENGSKDTSRDTLGLTYSITEVTLNSTDVTSSNLFTITNSGDTGNPAPGLLRLNAYMAQNLITNVYNVKIKVVDAGHTTSTPSSDEHTVAVTIAPGVLYNMYTAPNHPQLCTPTSSTIYITKPLSNTGGTSIQAGDTIYTNSNLTSTFFGLILTQLIGGEYDQGLYANVRDGSGNGVVYSIGNSRSCQTTNP